MQKRYNLATPELIAKLIEVGAHADTARSSHGLQYRVRVAKKFAGVIDPLLTGSKLRAFNKARYYYCFYSKDVWNALVGSGDRRNTYGHVSVNKLHCGLPVNAFKFTDGSIIKLCRNLACTEFDAHRQRVLRGGL